MGPTIAHLLDSPALKLFHSAAEKVLRRERLARRRYRASLTEDVRAEFINGNVVVQPPARDMHIRVTMNLMFLLDAFCVGRKVGTVFTTHALAAFTRNDYCPDVCYWGNEKARRFSPNQLIHPVPDMVCEVLSPETAGLDRWIKFEDYEAHRVGEYWIIDPQPRVEMIEQYVLEGNRYNLVGQFTKGTIRSRAVSGFKMPVRAAFDKARNMACLRQILGV